MNLQVAILAVPKSSTMEVLILLWCFRYIACANITHQNSIQTYPATIVVVKAHSSICELVGGHTGAAKELLHGGLVGAGDTTGRLAGGIDSLAGQKGCQEPQEEQREEGPHRWPSSNEI